jgi:hypothetical protein
MAISSFVGRIFFAERLQLKPPAKLGNYGFRVKSKSPRIALAIKMPILPPLNFSGTLCCETLRTI